MLVLGRNEDQSLILKHGNTIIKVTVSSFRGKSVKLGITAPPDVDVWREEIYYKILNGAENLRKPDGVV